MARVQASLYFNLTKSVSWGWHNYLSARAFIYACASTQKRKWEDAAAWIWEKRRSLRNNKHRDLNVKLCNFLRQNCGLSGRVCGGRLIQICAHTFNEYTHKSVWSLYAFLHFEGNICTSSIQSWTKVWVYVNIVTSAGDPDKHAHFLEMPRRLTPSIYDNRNVDRRI